MLKRISVLLVSALLMVALAANVALAEQPPGKGNAGKEFDTTHPEDTGAPEEPQGETPQGFGGVTSQRASTVHDVGEHSSDPVEGDDDRETPRLGVGNVSRNDDFLVGLAGIADPGPRPGDHACLIGEADDKIGQDDQHVTDCTADPGLPTKP